MNKAIAESHLHDVTGFKLLHKYTIRIEFDDKSIQIIDFEPVLYGPIFGQLRDIEIFNQVSLNSDIGTLFWPNGADIDPNVLYHWPEHIDAIIEQRQQQFMASA